MFREIDIPAPLLSIATIISFCVVNTEIPFDLTFYGPSLFHPPSDHIGPNHLCQTPLHTPSHSFLLRDDSSRLHDHTALRSAGYEMSAKRESRER